MPTLSDLQRINTTVNQIPYVELAAPGEADDLVKDTPNGGSWVCRDYAVRKSIQLQQLGMTNADYTLVICWTEPEGDPPQRGRHEVLAVKLGGKTYIMDSRYDQVGLWDADPWTAYQWEHQQIAGTLDWRAASQGLV